MFAFHSSFMIPPCVFQVYKLKEDCFPSHSKGRYAAEVFQMPGRSFS